MGIFGCCKGDVEHQVADQSRRPGSNVGAEQSSTRLGSLVTEQNTHDARILGDLLRLDINSLPRSPILTSTFNGQNEQQGVVEDANEFVVTIDDQDLPHVDSPLTEYSDNESVSSNYSTYYPGQEEEEGQDDRTVDTPPISLGQSIPDSPRGERQVPQTDFPIVYASSTPVPSPDPSPVPTVTVISDSDDGLSTVSGLTPNTGPVRSEEVGSLEARVLEIVDYYYGSEEINNLDLRSKP